MPESGSPAALEGLALEGVEWLPSGADAGLLRVRGLWTDLARREEGLPALGLRRGEEVRRFESLPDARFGRDPAVWRGTYLVPSALMDPAPDELWLSWESGVQAALPAPVRGFDPPATAPASDPPPDAGGEVIDRAVLAERRARRAETAERAQAARAAEALKAVEVLELRSAELERRLEALQSEAPDEEREGPVAPESAAASAVAEAEALGAAADAVPAAEVAGAAAVTEPRVAATPAPPEPSVHPPALEPPSGPTADALAEAVATVKRLRHELGEQRQRLRRSELLGAADAVALANLRDEQGRAHELQQELAARERELADALAAADALAREAATAREQAAEQVALAAQRSAADSAEVRRRAAEELAAARAALAETRSELDAERAALAETRSELDTAARDLSAERDEHAQARERLAARERELAAIGDDLARVREELATVRHGAAQRAAGLERRLSELDAALAAERRGHGIAATERETARASLALAESARSAESVARAALDDELDRERLAHATLAAALDAANAELSQARAQAASAEASAAAELGESRAQAAALQAELDAVRERSASAEASAAAELSEARAQMAALQAGLGESRAQAAALQAELDAVRERSASAEASAAAELSEARAHAVSLQSDLDGAREQTASAEASASDLRAALDAATAEIAVARDRIAQLEHKLEAGRGALDAAERDAGGLMARIAELETAADDDLDRRAREQTDAAAAVARPTDEEQRDLSASLDAAAAALRARPAPPEPAAEPRPVTEAVLADRTPPAEATAPPAEATAPPAEATAPPPATAAPAQAAPAPAIERRRPRIVTESKHPPRADILGTSKREYPWLRGALVKLAHDDPRAATRLVLGLVPVQRVLLESSLEYDLTIRGSGTYAISVAEQSAGARTIGGPRPRAEAAFHAAADIVTLTELLAGVEKRMGRWLGSVKVHGRRRDAETLRAALSGAGLDLAAAARAGADLDPDLVFRAFAYAIHPAWTRGHAFTVAQEIAGPRPIRWHIAVRDGAPVSVDRRAPAEPPDAVVAMSRDTFGHLLRGEQAPSGDRPMVRGDREAVALLKSWTDRAQGRA